MKFIFTIFLFVGFCSYQNFEDDFDSIQTLSTTPDLENASLVKAQHYRGHAASFSEHSDGEKPSMELWLTQRNLGGTIFRGGSLANAQVDINRFGRIDHGCYLNQGSQLGSYDNVNPYITQTRGGTETSVMKYAGGTNTANAIEYMRTRFIYGGNSSYEHNSTATYNYGSGQTDTQMINRGGTISFEQYCALKNYASPAYIFPACDCNPNCQPADYAACSAEGYAILASLVPQVANNGGWYINFMHAPQYTDNYPRDYFRKVDSLMTVTGVDIYRGTANTIADYYWVRESVDSIEGITDTVKVFYSKKYPNSPYQKIQTPLWITVDLNDTYYAGKDITTSHGGKIRSLGNNIYCISLSLNFTNTFASFRILETTTPTYINLNKPVLNVSGNSVTSDQPIKIVVWQKAKTAFEVAATVLERNVNTSTAFTLTKSRTPATKDYYLGFINSEGVSGVIVNPW